MKPSSMWKTILAITDIVGNGLGEKLEERTPTDIRITSDGHNISVTIDGALALEAHLAPKKLRVPA